MGEWFDVVLEDVRDTEEEHDVEEECNVEGGACCGGRV